MEFRLGEVYALPEGESPAWIRDSLRVATAGRVGNVPVTLFLLDGRQVTRNFAAVDTGSDWDDEFESVYLESLRDPDSLDEVRCRDITAFYLVPEGPIDHSDELRGGT